MFTVIFQLSHTLEHFIEVNAYEKEHRLHSHFNQKREYVHTKLEYNVHHNTLSDCFACDHMLNPYIGVDPIEFIVLEEIMVFKAITLQQHNFTLPLTLFFSLRAPPVFV